MVGLQIDNKNNSSRFVRKLFVLLLYCLWFESLELMKRVTKFGLGALSGLMLDLGLLKISLGGVVSFF